MALDSDQDDLSPSVATLRHSPFEWLRGPARYGRATDEISLDREKAELYFPSDEAGILFELAEIKAPADAVSFTQRYGLLTKGPAGENLHESFTEIRDEAELLALFLRLYELLERAHRGDPDAVRELQAVWYKRLRQSAEKMGVSSLPPADDQALIAYCRAFLTWMTNEGMRGTELVVFTEDDGWSLSGWPADLLSHAYQELAFLIVKREPARVCEECGRVFVVEHGRQRFCSPSCSGRARNRRWREARKEKGSG